MRDVTPLLLSVSLHMVAKQITNHSVVRSRTLEELPLTGVSLRIVAQQITNQEHHELAEEEDLRT